jgi:signal transduction histidine kinase
VPLRGNALLTIARMPVPNEAPRVAHRALRRSASAWRVAGATPAALLPSVAFAQAEVPLSSGLALFGGIALILIAALAFGAGWLLAQRRGAVALHGARLHGRLLAQLLDVWQWQTDRHHRLLRLQPPMGAPADAWPPDIGSGQPLWERFAGDGARGADGLRAQLESMVPLSDVAVHQPAAQGDAQWCLRGMPCFDADGQFAGYIGTARPATGAAAASTGTLLPLGSASADPELLSEQAAFSYTVTHDLRAPIRVVEGFARILKEDYARVLDRIGNDHLDRVLAAAARMNSKIDALLTLANLSAQPLARQPVNLSQLAGFVVDDLRRSSPDRQVAVEIAPNLHVDGDPTLLRLVLENLLGNAWKYSARNAQAQIALSCTIDASRPVFCVSDNGAGFDMRNADRLFGVFQRLHSANDFPGTGVGLASVKRIVRRHGGDVWAESEAGHGARFYFTLRP